MVVYKVYTVASIFVIDSTYKKLNHLTHYQPSTNRMGYTISWDPLRFTDTTYKTVITLLPKILHSTTTCKVESWGFVITDSESEYADYDSIAFCRDGNQSPWEKTNRHPYTKEAMKALILMVEYGVTQNLDHDDDSMAWYLEALEEVHEKHTLVSYQQQKKYFVELEIKKRQENLLV